MRAVLVIDMQEGMADRIRSGRPRHLECSGHAWTTRERFDDFPFSKADLEIIRALRALPEPPRLRDVFPKK